jgi:hypothetical protein
LNRYKGGNDYVGWHADDEKLYGPTPEIASLSLGCDRDFVLKKKPSKKSCGMEFLLLLVLVITAVLQNMIIVSLNTTYHHSLSFGVVFQMEVMSLRASV